jgi:hypothetical protein
VSQVLQSNSINVLKGIKMIEVVGKGPWRVTVIESEAGWGQKVDEYRRFETKEEAEAWVKNYNAKNNLPQTPDWYMYAQSPSYVP